MKRQLTNVYPLETAPAHGPLHHWPLPTERRQEAVPTLRRGAPQRSQFRQQAGKKSTNLMAGIPTEKPQSLFFFSETRITRKKPLSVHKFYVPIYITSPKLFT